MKAATQEKQAPVERPRRSNSKPGMTIAVAAAYCDLSPARFNELLNSKGLTRNSVDGYDPDMLRVEYIRYLRVRAANSGGASLSEARAKLTAEQFEAAAIKNAVSRGDYIPLERWMRKVVAMIANCRERILSIPGKIADECQMRTREEIEVIIVRELSEALDELSIEALGRIDADNRSGISEGDADVEVAAEADAD